MPIPEPFWQYAKEALLAALKAKSDEDRDRFLALARTWTDAALIEQHSLANRDKQIPHETASVGELSLLF